MGKPDRSEKKKKQINNGNMVGLGAGLKKGPWTPEEDRKLLSYIQQFGHGSWRSLPTKAGNYDNPIDAYILYVSHII